MPTNISASVPDQCDITFAQLLSRHGARGPTTFKDSQFRELIDKIHKKVSKPSLKGKYSFLANVTHFLDIGDLTVFGQQQMVNSGIKFFNRYCHLAANYTLFIRAGDQNRVVESAVNFTQGFHATRLASQRKSLNTTYRYNSLNAASPHRFLNTTYPYPILLISEGEGSNNTLKHGTCKIFEIPPISEIKLEAQKTWSSIFVPPIQRRINNGVPGANFSIYDIILLMDMCPFKTVASPAGTLSAFCSLFTVDEWRQYDYYWSLGKYYGYGSGNPLGPTQGVGWVEELLARLTGERSFVASDLYTNIDHTLDDDPVTFPLGEDYPLYADFSHDSNMVASLAALGLYNITATNGLLPKTEARAPIDVGGFSTSWVTPFAARIYIEKMACRDQNEELVRAIVNDRVVPLQNCGADRLGRCRLSAFVESLGFAKSGGHWNKCYT